ncbi:aminotransferase class I/II-fold pyridoxal phosphate-dependent enzyme [[Clostridium] scindens]|uniref:aminotransferase class I/II-fold pyridoxal phosphate-dependent enzyme n=1 Tax=Clostridium scindens (strain JCM 10418 / VPI 12708) TaxID=29347 RepID=UPI001570FD34|nr:aminotransferase class I/II-fold pyridoxal phosphate-dependent enzyme [[Clostridium] scindens]NSI88892.1 aminotransferase class V-fold PLP-dependent enzyme [[Clostridium] scindens]NSJ03670.1 aminotransferase class V-fold PLP-dependent enzyme [[Clostridium] scindens]
MSTIYDKLKDYSDSDYYGFHMPGHKRNLDMLKSTVPYKIDITEIEGFDDLHHAEGILKEAQIRAARIYHADETHFLINGSTVGILSAIAGVTKKGDTILVARNCHKSVYHAIYMNELNPVYLYPEFNHCAQLNTEVSVDDVREALDKYPSIRAVVIVSPTYDGVVSDVEAIAEAVHEKGIPLIVDEAHGAHFGFHPYFPQNANTRGADIVIHSLHKTLPALTQTALLHINGSLASRKGVREYLRMLQSSSPSYVLMSSIDSCIDMLENRRKELFDPYVKMLEKMRGRLRQLKRLELVETENFDRSKIVISVRHADMSSKRLYRILLNEYHLQMEMVAGTYILAMTSIGDTEDGMERLARALKEIDAQADERMRSGNCLEETPTIIGASLPRPEVVYNSSVMENMLDEAAISAVPGSKVRRLPWRDSVGYISTEYAYLYPPGSPLIVPGERVSQEAADMLQWYHNLRFAIEGLKEDQYIEVWMHG